MPRRRRSRTNPDHGLNYSVSWHSYGGAVAYPMGHTTSNGLNPADRPRFDAVSQAYADAADYVNLQDDYEDVYYPTYGDSNDWLYKTKGVTAILVETYSPIERGVEGPCEPGYSPCFFPDTLVKRNAVVANNIQAALALINACAQPVCLKATYAETLIAIAIQTAPGAAYLLEYKTSLTERAWSVLHEIPGTGEIVTITDDSIRSAPQRFYRLQQR